MPYVIGYLGAKGNVSRMCYCPLSPLFRFLPPGVSLSPPRGQHRPQPSHGNASLQMASFLDERRAIKFFYFDIYAFCYPPFAFLSKIHSLLFLLVFYYSCS